MDFIDICSSKGYGFSAVLVIKGVSSFAILMLNRVYFWRFSLELGVVWRMQTVSGHKKGRSQAS